MSIRPSRSSGAAMRGRGLVVLGGVLAALVVPAVASANSTNISTGSAYDLALKTSLFSTLLTAGPVVGPVSSNGTTNTSQCAGTLSTSIANASLLCASVATTNEGAVSTAKVAGLTAFLPLLPTIEGSLITAKATATCRNHGTTIGVSTGGSITVNGMKFAIAGPPNTVITLPLGLGTITLNEQVRTGNSIAVKAIDVNTILGTELVVGSASAGVSNCR